MKDRLYNNFTPEELDTLSKAYLECRLSKVQVKELELILSCCDVTSPIIDEARETMGIETVLGCAKLEKISSTTPKRRWAKWWSAAACIAVVALVGVINIVKGYDNDSNIVVFVDGKRLSSELAEKKAAETQAMCMAMLEETIETAQNIQNESIRFLN